MKKLTSDIQQNNDFTFIDLLKQNKKLEMYGNKFELIDGRLKMNGWNTLGFFVSTNGHIGTSINSSQKVFIAGEEFKNSSQLNIDNDGSIKECMVGRWWLQGKLFGFNKDIIDLNLLSISDDIFYKTKDDKIIEANHYPKYRLSLDGEKLRSKIAQEIKETQNVSPDLLEQLSRYKKIRSALGYNSPYSDNKEFADSAISISCWKIGENKMLFCEGDGGWHRDSTGKIHRTRFVLWDEKHKQVVTICDQNTVDRIMADEQYIYLQSYDNNKLKTDILSLSDFGIVKTIEKDVNDESQTSHINRETLSYYDENNMNKMIKAFVSEQQQKVQAVNKIQRVFRKYKKDKQQKKVQAVNKIQRAFRKYKKDKQQNNNNINLNLENKKVQKKDDCVIC